MHKEKLNIDDAFVWAACHASRQPIVEDPPAVSALLLLFYEKAATPAMIRHGMDVQRRAIEYINQGQIPVTIFDRLGQAKLVQWKWPVTHSK